MRAAGWTVVYQLLQVFSFNLFFTSLSSTLLRSAEITVI